MTRSQILTTFLLVMVLGAFLYSISNILMPFVVGFVLAYLLAPLVNRLTRWGVPRAIAAIVPICLAVLVMLFVVVAGLPLLIEQVSSFVQRLPMYIITLKTFVLPHRMGEVLTILQQRFNFDMVLRSLTSLSSEGVTMGLSTLQRGLAGAAAAFNIVLLAFMTPMVAYYLMADWPTFTHRTIAQLPRRWRPVVTETLMAIDLKLSAYLRGMLSVCGLLGLFYGFALHLMGLELGWAIGMATGLLAFLPMVGATIGVLAMFGVAVVQYQLQTWEPYALIALIFVLGQIIEGYILTPLLVGRQVGLHPLWVMFALLAGATVWGFMGMLLALPVAVIVAEVIPPILRAWRKQLA